MGGKIRPAGPIHDALKVDLEPIRRSWGGGGEIAVGKMGMVSHGNLEHLRGLHGAKTP